MSAESPPGEILNVTLKFPDVDIFAERFLNFLERHRILLPGVAPRPLGTRLRFHLKLKDGTPLISGDGQVELVVAQGQLRGCPPGLLLRFESDEASRALCDRILAPRGEAPSPVLPPAKLFQALGAEKRLSGASPAKPSESDVPEGSKAKPLAGSPGTGARPSLFAGRARPGVRPGEGSGPVSAGDGSTLGAGPLSKPSLGTLALPKLRPISPLPPLGGRPDAGAAIELPKVEVPGVEGWGVLDDMPSVLEPAQKKAPVPSPAAEAPGAPVAATDASVSAAADDENLAGDAFAGSASAASAATERDERSDEDEPPGAEAADAPRVEASPQQVEADSEPLSHRPVDQPAPEASAPAEPSLQAAEALEPVEGRAPMAEAPAVAPAAPTEPTQDRSGPAVEEAADEVKVEPPASVEATDAPEAQAEPLASADHAEPPEAEGEAPSLFRLALRAAGVELSSEDLEEVDEPLSPPSLPQGDEVASVEAQPLPPLVTVVDSPLVSALAGGSDGETEAFQPPPAVEAPASPSAGTQADRIGEPPATIRPAGPTRGRIIAISAAALVVAAIVGVALGMLLP